MVDVKKQEIDIEICQQREVLARLETKRETATLEQRALYVDYRRLSE